MSRDTSKEIDQLSSSAMSFIDTLKSYAKRNPDLANAALSTLSRMSKSGIVNHRRSRSRSRSPRGIRRSRSRSPRIIRRAISPRLFYSGLQGDGQEPAPNRRPRYGIPIVDSSAPRLTPAEAQARLESFNRLREQQRVESQARYEALNQRLEQERAAGPVRDARTIFNGQPSAERGSGSIMFGQLPAQMASASAAASAAASIRPAVPLGNRLPLAPIRPANVRAISLLDAPDEPPFPESMAVRRAFMTVFGPYAFTSRPVGSAMPPGAFEQRRRTQTHRRMALLEPAQLAQLSMIEQQQFATDQALLEQALVEQDDPMDVDA